MTTILKNWSKSGEPFIRGKFIERPNRFLISVKLKSGEVVKAHLPDPGRLTHLLCPNAEILLDGPFDQTQRKTSYSAALVRAKNGSWVCLDSQMPNRLFPILLKKGELPSLWPKDSPQPTIKREVSYKNSRFDFKLLGPTTAHWIVVKSVTWSENKIGLFPDAPTKRGQKHLLKLAELAKRGEKTSVLFIAQRDDVKSIQPATEIDPLFAKALAHAQKNGVSILALSLHYSPEQISSRGEIPFQFPPQLK